MKKSNLFIAAVVAAVSLLFIGCQNDTSDDEGSVYYYYSSSEKRLKEKEPTDLDWSDIEAISGIKDKSQLINFQIPERFTSIANGAFLDCVSLIAVGIPSSIKTIGIGAFDGCSKLVSVNIPSSVTVIGRNAFHGCPALTGIAFEDSEAKWKEEKGAFGSYATLRMNLSSDDVAEAIKTKDTSFLRYVKQN